MGKNKKKGKGRKKKHGVADKVIARKQHAANSAPEARAMINPFELKINRQKHAILGRKSKHDKGLPGISRSKAIAKRKESLLSEYRQRNKSNRFIDKRIGEYDANLTPEAKMLARFAAERQRDVVGVSGGKSNIFSLEGDEDDGESSGLTHYGQSLADIEKFDDPRSDSEDEEEKSAAADFFKKANFGGFLTKREDEDGGGGGEAAGPKKSRKDMIDDLIAQSKQRKYEKQVDKEATQDLTEKLDNEWKDVRGLVGHLKNSKDASGGEKQPMDDYDVKVRELKFDMRAKPTNRLKTPEEIARVEKEKLEKLEQERLLRMRGQSKMQGRHVSADDLDDGLMIGNEKKRFCVRYKDGKLVEPLPKEASTETKSEDDDDDESCKDGDSNESGEDENDDDDDKEDDEESDSNPSDLEDEENSNGFDDFAPKSRQKRKVKFATDQEASSSTAESELPFVFSMPENYDSLLELFGNRPTADRLTIVERIIRCHHPCLAEENRGKLEVFFVLLLQLVNDAVVRDEEEGDSSQPDLALVDGLVPFLFDLLHLCPESASRAFLDVLLEKVEDFQQKGGGNVRTYPKLDTLVFLKVVPLLFPTSDFRHPVATPASLFLLQMQHSCRVKGLRDLVAGLFVSNLLYDYVALSKRFVPEALAFLQGTLTLMKSNRSGPPEAATAHIFRAEEDLELQRDCTDWTESIQPLTLGLLNDDHVDATDELKLSVMRCVFELIHRYVDLYTALPSCAEVFRGFLEPVRGLPTAKFPAELSRSFQRLVDKLEEVLVKGAPKRRRLVRDVHQQGPRQRRPLKLLEPRIEEVFDGRKRRRGGADKATQEKQRLLHRYKREMKGAIREIRRDNQFLAKQQLQEQLARDAERKRKLKELYHDLATQEGNCKVFEKKKKK